MGIFQVRRYPENDDYKKVEAQTAKEAAEKVYGRPLSEVGTNGELRVLVHPMIWPRQPSPMLFYDRG